jgi:protein gp37
MGDIMTTSLTDLEIYSVLDSMMICDWHRFQVQTKYEKRLPEFKYPSNVWLGVSICYERDLIRLEYLLETDARIKYAYVEPLLEEMDPDFNGIDWVVIGAKTGVHPFKPQLHWVSHLVKKAEEVGAAVFMKSNLGPLHYIPLLREFPDKEWMDKAYPDGLIK